jgi:hypothetical protein
MMSIQIENFCSRQLQKVELFYLLNKPCSLLVMRKGNYNYNRQGPLFSDQQAAISNAARHEAVLVRKRKIAWE